METGYDDAAAQAVVAIEELRAHPVVDRRRHRRFEVWVAASPEGRDAGKDGRDWLVRIQQLGTQFFVGVGREAARRTGFGSSRHRLALGVEPVADAEVPAANELMPVGRDVAEQHIHGGWLDVDVAVDGAGLDRAHIAPLLAIWHGRPPPYEIPGAPKAVRHRGANVICTWWHAHAGRRQTSEGWQSARNRAGCYSARCGRCGSLPQVEAAAPQSAATRGSTCPWAPTCAEVLAHSAASAASGDARRQEDRADTPDDFAA